MLTEMCNFTLWQFFVLKFLPFFKLVFDELRGFLWLMANTCC